MTKTTILTWHPYTHNFVEQPNSLSLEKYSRPSALGNSRHSDPYRVVNNGMFSSILSTTPPTGCSLDTCSCTMQFTCSSLPPLTLELDPNEGLLTLRVMGKPLFPHRLPIAHVTKLPCRDQSLANCPFISEEEDCEDCINN